MTFIQGDTSLLNAEVVAKSIGNASVVTTPAIADTGFVALACESDDGTVLGTKTRLQPEATPDYRMRVGIDSILDQEVFNYTNQNTGKHSYLTTTMTLALSASGLVTNSGSLTAINTATHLRTQRNFTLNGQQAPLFVETVFSLSSTSMATNSTLDFGLFQQSGSSPYAPSDGIYFRLTSAGLFGVINNNGTETVGSALTFTFTANRIYQFVITVTNTVAQFWIDDVLYSTVQCPTTQQALFLSQSLPWAVRHAISGTAAGSVVQGKVWSYSVFCGDVNRSKDWGATCVALGGSQQVQQGATTGGQLSTYALGAAPGAVTLTASTAPATNTLGGLFLLPTAITPAESDYPIFAWQNPAGTAALPGKIFHCTGCIVGDLLVATALAGGPLGFMWAIGFGSTAASLATTEIATFGGTTTKIARKLPLGVAQTLAATAAVGTIAAGRQVMFPETIPVNPGEFLHAILRVPAGTATSAGAIRGSFTFTGYFE